MFALVRIFNKNVDHQISEAHRIGFTFNKTEQTKQNRTEQKRASL